MLKRINIIILVVTIILSFAVVCTANTSQSEVYTWTHQCAFDEADFEYQSLKPFVKAVEEESNGRLIIKTYPGGAIVPVEEMLSNCSAGVIDVCHAGSAYWRGIVPLGNVNYGLPFMYMGGLDTIIDLLYNFQDGKLDKLFREAWEKQGNVYYVGSHSIHAFPIIMSNKAIVEVEDLKGLKIRITGAGAELLSEVGASPMFLPGGELYMAIKLGTVDAITWSADGYLGYKFYEVAKFVNISGLGDHSLNNFLINLNAWNKLPDDLKEIYIKAYREIYVPTLYDAYEAEYKKIKDRQEELGYTVTEFSDESIKELTKIAREKVWPKAKEDEYCTEAIEIIEKYYEEK